jgi:hypothetical protein
VLLTPGILRQDREIAVIEHFVVSARARIALQNAIDPLKHPTLLPTILWAYDVDANTALGRDLNAGTLAGEAFNEHVSRHGLAGLLSPGRWEVAYHSREKVSADNIVLLDGLEFYIDEMWHSALEGKTLDFM